MRKSGLVKKFDKCSNYVSELKLIIMDEVFFVYRKIENAMEIITAWLELNDTSPPQAWARLEAASIHTLWGMMVNRVVIK